MAAQNSNVNAKSLTSKMNTQRLENATDVRYEPLYDTAVLPASAITTINSRLFVNPIGGAVTKAQTNMTLAGTLPSPQAMVVRGIKVEAIVYSGADWELLVKLIRGTYISLFVGTKSYLEVPLSYIAGKQHLKMAGSKNDGTAKRFCMQIGEGNENGCVFADHKVLKIAPQENFYMDWIGSISHTPALATPVKFYLEGIRYVEVR